MRIDSIRIENVKSFRDATEVNFNRSLNVLIGPNAGGKSNLLDTLTTILRQFFLVGYHVHKQQAAPGASWRVEVVQPFTSQPLEPFVGSVRPLSIDLTFAIDQRDIDNLIEMKEQREHLVAALSKFHNAHEHDLTVLARWNLDGIHVGDTIEYSIRNNAVEGISHDAHDTKSMFYQYLRLFELASLLAREGLSQLHLPPAYLYFSPFRGVGHAQSFVANLSDTTSSGLRTGHFGATSRAATSLIALATTYFAEKMRRLEILASDVGYLTMWDADEEVQLVSRYLCRIGYTWRLVVVDPRTNSYQVELTKDGATFDVGRASSGEQEIINYIFGIFALNLKNGILVIDEAELHLHPRWQSLLLDLFFEIHDATGNQIIISTHSGTFITGRSVSHVTRIYKDPENVSRIARIRETDLPEMQQMLHMITTHNNEKMFFADVVVLVEGIKDRLLFERLLMLYKSHMTEIKIVEVLEVHGKSHFKRYRELLQALGVTVCEIGDFDYILEVAPGELRDLFEVDHRAIERNVLRNKKSGDRQSLSRSLDEALDTGDLDALRDLWSHIRHRHLRIREQLSIEEHQRVEHVFDSSALRGVYVLRNGEIEDYLPSDSQSMDGAIRLTSDGLFETWLMENWTTVHIMELRRIARAILGFTDPLEQLVLQAVQTTVDSLRIPQPEQTPPRTVENTAPDQESTAPETGRATL